MNYTGYYHITGEVSIQAFDEQDAKDRAQRFVEQATKAEILHLASVEIEVSENNGNGWSVSTW